MSCQGKVAYDVRQTWVLIGYDQAHMFRTPVLEVAEKAFPASLILPASFSHAKHLLIAFRIHSYGDKDRNILEAPSPWSFQPYAIDKYIRITAIRRIVPPFFYAGMDLFIRVADGARTDTAALKRFCEVFNVTHRNSGQVHLHQGFFCGTFPLSASFDHGCLKRQVPQFGNIQVDFSGCRLKIPCAVSGPGACLREFRS